MINSLLCWSVTLLMFIQTLHSSQPAGRIGDFEIIFFSGFAKSPRVLRSSWILSEYNLYYKIVKYCILRLSKVCMIKTAPHSTISPQVMYKKFKRLVYTPPDLLARFCKANFWYLSSAKNSAWFVFQEFFFRPNLLWSTANLWLLNVIEEDCCFLGGK